jgi:hypothetical protein
MCLHFAAPSGPEGGAFFCGVFCCLSYFHKTSKKKHSKQKNCPRLYILKAAFGMSDKLGRDKINTHRGFGRDKLNGIGVKLGREFIKAL